jgi:hypothetical protein
VKPRYIPIRLVKPATFHPSWRGGAVIEHQSGRRMDALIPVRYARAFWQATPGTRIRARIFPLGGPKVVRHHRRMELKLNSVLFRVVSVEAAA